MKKACHFALSESAFGGKHSAFRLPPSPARNATHSVAGGAFLHAFTLLEIMIATTLFGLVVAGTISVYIMCNKVWHTTSLSMQTTRDCNFAMSRLIYGVGTNSGLRAATSIAISSNADGWNIACPNPFDGAVWVSFNRQASNICWSNIIASQLICDHVCSALAVSTNSGVNITLAIYRKDGQFTSISTNSTFIKRRNQ